MFFENSGKHNNISLYSEIDRGNILRLFVNVREPKFN